MKTCPMTFLFVSVVYLINYFKEMTIPLCKKVFNASKMISKYFFVTKTFIKCTVQVNNDTVSSDRLSTDKYDRLSTDKYVRLSTDKMIDYLQINMIDYLQINMIDYLQINMIDYLQIK